MATEKQIAANRRNSAKSTGPRTTQGKATAARNALRHGIFAQSLLLRTENPAHFAAMADAFYNEFQPTNASESALVDTMISVRWRIRRMTSLEAAGVDIEYEQARHHPAPSRLPEEATVPMRANLAYRNLAETGRTLDLMSRMEARYHRQFDTALNQYHRLREARAKSAENSLDLIGGLIPPPSNTQTKSIYPLAETKPTP